MARPRLACHRAAGFSFSSFCHSFRLIHAISNILQHFHARDKVVGDYDTFAKLVEVGFEARSREDLGFYFARLYRLRTQLPHVSCRGDNCQLKGEASSGVSGEYSRCLCQPTTGNAHILVREDSCPSTTCYPRTPRKVDKMAVWDRRLRCLLPQTRGLEESEMRAR